MAADNKSLYLGQDGRLWKIELPSGRRQHLAFRARVRLEVQAPTPPPTWTPAALGSSAPPRTVLSPRLSPDGRSLVFGAADYLWQQPLDGGEAERLFEGSAFERAPAFSPDGRQLAFVHGAYGKEEVRVFDFENRQMRTLASGLTNTGLSWSPDGQRLVFAVNDPGRYRVVAVNVSDGKKEKLPELGARSPSRLDFSPDGQSLYFSADLTGTQTLYRLPLNGEAEPEAVAQLPTRNAGAHVSPDGKWVAFRRDTEIWVASLGPAPDGSGLNKDPVPEEDFRQLSPEGDFSFAFTPDSSAVIYAAGNRVWLHPLAGSEREEIPIRLELARPTPPPLLVRRVRVLDFDTGAFGPETSLFIEQGRIRWTGSERGRLPPRQTVTVDAGGRFAIPGLLDMHGHSTTNFFAANQEAFLAYGVTSVRDVGGRFTWLNALADRGEATSDPVPRHFFSGGIFGAGRGTRLDIRNKEDARTYVRRWKQRGAHFIKVYPPLSWQLQRAVAEEARRLGLPVVGHSDYLERVTKSVTLGYASLEHTLSPPPSDDVLQMLALAGTRWDPTVATRYGLGLLLRDEPERLAGTKFRAFTPEWRIRREGVTSGDMNRAVAARGYWVETLASIRAAHRRGVRLLAGGHVTPLGPVQLHWELEHLVQAGLAPLEVLRIATQEGAAAVGAEEHLGTLEVGKLADIVLLDANPLEDIKNTQTIWRVIKGGWVFDPEELQRKALTSSGQ